MNYLLTLIIASYDITGIKSGEFMTSESCHVAGIIKTETQQAWAYECTKIKKDRAKGKKEK